MACNIQNKKKIDIFTSEIINFTRYSQILSYVRVDLTYYLCEEEFMKLSTGVYKCQEV